MSDAVTSDAVLAEAPRIGDRLLLRWMTGEHRCHVVYVWPDGKVRVRFEDNGDEGVHHFSRFAAVTAEVLS